jgi:hypothetical protein
MNARVQTPGNLPPRYVILAVICLLVCPSWAMAKELSENPTSMPFEAGGTVRMSLSTGTVEVVGAKDDKITVSWHSRLPEEERDVSVKLQRFGRKDATVVVDGPGDRMHYRIEVPQQSNVTIRMRAGDLDVHGILGSVEAHLLAGSMDLRVAEPRHYHSVSASVTAGELTARPWRIDTGGLWRSFKANSDGEYDLRAQVLAGQLTIRSE